MSTSFGAAILRGPGDRQATIRRSFSLQGRGLHTGARSSVTVEPAPTGAGIVFLRTRREGTVDRIPALWCNAVRRPLCTALAVEGGPPLLTVEHLLAALSAFRIDNAVIRVEGDELPIFDGSAVAWCRALAAAGRAEQAEPRRYIGLRRPLEVTRGHRLLRIEPSDALSLDVRIDLGGFGPLHWKGPVTPEIFVSDIAPSRSFGRLKWALPLKLYSLIGRQPVLRGAHFGSVAVLWGGRVIGGMRVPDEPVRHRALDLVGDLSLAGLPLLAHVTARHVGHDINGALVAALMSAPEAWTIVPGSGPPATSQRGEPA